MHRIHAVTLVLLAGLVGCSTETLFQENFNTTAVNASPAATQAVGTASWFGSPNSVVIADSPPGSSDHWLRIGRADNGQDIAGMIATLAALKPPGTFHFSTVMYMPPGSNTATIEFDAFGETGNGNRLGFMHLDFRRDNNVDHVRIDDNPATDFGTFARNTPFDVFVTLSTSASPPTAHIALVGANASGTVDYPITVPSLAQQFDSVTFWMGYPWTGTFLSTGATVTHDTQ